jgi:hypothetical protein
MDGANTENAGAVFSESRDPELNIVPVTNVGWIKAESTKYY